MLKCNYDLQKSVSAKLFFGYALEKMSGMLQTWLFYFRLDKKTEGSNAVWMKDLQI